MSIRTPDLPGTRLGIALCLALVWLGSAASVAAAQDAGTLTVRLTVVPASDGGRFDLAIDGAVLVAGVGDGGATAALPIASGSATVSEFASSGTSLASYSTAVTCVDGDTILIDAAPLTATPVAVARGHDVVCTFVNTLQPAVPVTAPTVAAPPFTPMPIVLPPAFVRGTAILRGVEGCTARRTVTTRVIGRNIERVVFVRDGRIVKRIAAPSLSWRTYELRTTLRDDDHEVHTVFARAFFIRSATPRVKAMTHRFARCRASVVTG